MKTTQYVRQERAIAAADAGGIRERWMWGLRVLRDLEAMTESGKSLRRGVADQLIAAARQRGIKLFDREIQRRIQCARTYPTEAQIRQILTDFPSWDQLINAGFPPVDAPEDEPEADHRTRAEQQRDRNRDLAERGHQQEALFPLDEFEPAEVTLKQLQDYADEQDQITERFAAHGRKRRAYLNQLITAAEGDMSVTWEVALPATPGRQRPARALNPTQVNRPGRTPCPGFAAAKARNKEQIVMANHVTTQIQLDSAERMTARVNTAAGFLPYATVDLILPDVWITCDDPAVLDRLAQVITQAAAELRAAQAETKAA